MEIKKIIRAYQLKQEFRVLSAIYRRAMYKLTICNVPIFTCHDFKKGMFVSCTYIIFVFLFVIKIVDETVSKRSKGKVGNGRKIYETQWTNPQKERVPPDIERVWTLWQKPYMYPPSKFKKKCKVKQIQKRIGKWCVGSERWRCSICPIW